MTDQEIIEHIKNKNNEKAFLALYRHLPMIRKMILSNNGQAADAEDIYQEALIILCTKIRTSDFKLTSQLSTYLYSVCRFLWKDELKKRNKLPSVNFETGIDRAEENDLEELAAKESQTKLAEKIVSELGDRCKELLLLFYTSNMKLKEIAAKMGYSSENTAKNQKYKCLESAKKNLKESTQTLSVI